jgi:hypothetical protein
MAADAPRAARVSVAGVLKDQQTRAGGVSPLIARRADARQRRNEVARDRAMILVFFAKATFGRLVIRGLTPPARGFFELILCSACSLEELLRRIAAQGGILLQIDHAAGDRAAFFADPVDRRTGDVLGRHEPA